MKTRLNKAIRENIIIWANNNIDHCKKEKLDHEKSGEKLVKEISKHLEKRFPKKDMDILEKYGVLSNFHYVNIFLFDKYNSTLGSFSFPKEKRPRLPNSFSNNFANNFGEKCADLYIDYDKKRLILEKSLKQFRLDVSSVVYAAKTIEELVEAFPAIKDFPIQKRSSPVMIINEEMRNRVKNLKQTKK